MLNEDRGTLKTDYQGPTREESIEVAGQRLRLMRPAEPDRLLDALDVLALNRSDDYMPYWAYLWPGAYLLAEAVGRGIWPTGLKTLEIGCGLGLTGLVGLQRGLHVHFTDYDTAPLAFVEQSAEANGFDSDRYSTGRFDWREPEGSSFDLILGADVLYERKLVPLVADVLAARLAPDGIGLVSNPYRVAAEAFPEELARRGLTAEVEPIEAHTLEFGEIQGLVYRVRRCSEG